MIYFKTPLPCDSTARRFIRRTQERAHLFGAALLCLDSLPEHQVRVQRTDKDFIPARCLRYHQNGRTIKVEYTYSLRPMFWKKTKENGCHIKEYDEFAKDPEIGTRRNMSWKEAVLCFVAHETAHMLRDSFPVEANARYGTDYPLIEDEIGHDELWRELYRELRVEMLTWHV